MRSLRLLLLLLIVFADRAWGVIPPGHEPDVLRLVQGPLDGASLEAIRIGAEVIELDLATPGGRVTLTLEEKGSDGSTGEVVGETGSFVVRRRAGPPSEAEGRLVARIAERDDGGFFRRVEVATSGQPPVEARDPGGWDEVVRLLLWVSLLGALVVLVRPARRSLLAVMAVAALALVVRLGQPHAPLHANDHGTSELRGLSGTSSSTNTMDESDRYGPAYRQLVRRIAPLVGSGSASVFQIGILAGVLGCVAACALGLLLLGSVEAGFVAGAVLALHPAHARLSVSESPFTLAATLLLILLCGVAIGCDRARPFRERVAGAVLFGAGAALGSELAVTTLVLPVVGLLAIVVLAGRGDRRAVAGIFAAPLVVTAFVASVHLWSLWPLLHDASEARGASLLPTWGNFLRSNLLFDAEAASWLLVPIAFLGLVALVLRGRSRAALVLGLGAVLLLVANLSVLAARTDLLRYQTASHVLLAVACGGLVGSTLTRIVRTGIALLVVVALGATAWPGLRAPPSLDDQSFLLVRNAVRALPSEVVIVVPPPRMGRVRADFPEFLLTEQGIRQRVVDASHRVPGCYVWMPPACYAFTAEELSLGGLGGARFSGESIRAECEEAAAAADETQRALATEAEVPWRDGEFHRIVAARPLIGLFPCR